MIGFLPAVLASWEHGSCSRQDAVYAVLGCGFVTVLAYAALKGKFTTWTGISECICPWSSSV